jgi:demethylmenaquinone methyltransferase/2-methoxy-6-polyprenyl-1,4-benzoquinol methylase
MKPFDHFDFIAPIYDRVIKPKPPDDLLTHLNLSVDSRVLDAGGGTGRIARGLIPHAGDITILDLSPRMLREAVNTLGLQAILAPSESLPYRDNSFDAVLMVDALHHVIDQQNTLQELFRVVKPGGRLVVEEPDIRTFVVKIIAFLEKVVGMRSHFLTGEQIASMLASCCKNASVYRKEYTVWVVLEK